MGLDAPLVRQRSTVAPHDVRNAFWSSSSAIPGERGNAFVFGHTYDSKASGVGVFDHLKRLRPGMVYRLVVNGKALSYKVKSVVLNAPLHLSELAMAKQLSHLGPSRSTMTTCYWSPRLQKYVSRVMVQGVLNN
ncbi:MAG: class F sortase [Candidatus Saccharimonadales bacterium]